MTREDLFKVKAFFKREFLCTKVQQESYQFEVKHIENCGGIEYIVHPKTIMWENEMTLLISWCASWCLTVECRFRDGIIVIR